MVLVPKLGVSRTPLEELPITKNAIFINDIYVLLPNDAKKYVFFFFLTKFIISLLIMSASLSEFDEVIIIILFSRVFKNLIKFLI